MSIDNNLIIRSSENVTELPGIQTHSFSLSNIEMLWSPEAFDYNDFLEKWVFRIARKPKHLLAHVQRIYYCFHANLNEQLFAAIVDFLFVLNKRGQAISWRIVMGAKPRLNADQFDVLKKYLKDEHADINLLPGNQYSIFTRGLVGANNLVMQLKKQVQHDYDPLALARDYIEFSQLEEAKQVLEMAILDQPTRLDIHHELLAFYQSTRDSTGFNQMLAELTQLGCDLIDEWTELNIYFKGRNSDG
ncbi:MAG: hypothetical protein Q7U57_14330 [Methylovulum sp.]|nr:hypothetical protein [Methylovulum sp.]